LRLLKCRKVKLAGWDWLQRAPPSNQVYLCCLPGPGRVNEPGCKTCRRKCNAGLYNNNFTVELNFGYQLLCATNKSVSQPVTEILSGNKQAPYGIFCPE